MKAIAIFATIFALVLLLTKVANQMPPDPPTGIAFSLKAQKVIQCSETDITLVDTHDNKATHLEIDGIRPSGSWPPCSEYKADEVLDFYLTRGEKTHLASAERTSFFRKIL